MARSIRVADCVRLPDGRIGRVRAILGSKIGVRVRRTTSTTHQFVLVRATALERIECPRGWMSPAGYARYVRITVAKMRRRLAHERTTAKSQTARRGRAS